MVTVENPNRYRAVNNHWTGLLEWTTGLVTGFFPLGVRSCSKRLKNTKVGPKFLSLKAYTFSLSLKKVPKVSSDDKYDLTLSL